MGLFLDLDILDLFEIALIPSMLIVALLLWRVPVKDSDS
jgi:hypothetical protein